MLRKLRTKDGSETFLNEERGETYHSHSGAVDEALRKYVIPCKIADLALRGSIRILDVCFGLGYNSCVAIQEALRVNPNCRIEVVGLENDWAIIEKIQEIDPSVTFFQHYKKLNRDCVEFCEGNVRVELLVGDAREKVRELDAGGFDVIFFDPFSPKTQPDMWQVDFFKEMFRVLSDDGLLATYSCARMARENMAAAGFVYEDGPIVGRRGPGTVAHKWIDGLS